MSPTLPPARFKPLPLPGQILDLTLIQLSNWRWSWRQMLAAGIFTPVLGIVFMRLLSADASPERLGYILTGNLVLALMLDTLNKVCSNFSYMRAGGMLNYFAALPVYRHSLILATVLAFLLLALPSLVVVLLLGLLYLHLPLHVHPLLLLAAPLAAAPVAGIGALLGATARSPEEANTLSLVLGLGMMALGPVLLPPESLHPLLRTLGHLSPATYAASALRQVLLGPLTAQIWIDLAVLAGLTWLVLWLVGRKLDWRQR